MLSTFCIRPLTTFWPLDVCERSASLVLALALQPLLRDAWPYQFFKVDRDSREPAKSFVESSSDSLLLPEQPLAVTSLFLKFNALIPELSQ